MNKDNQSKKLYHFNKHQKNKQSSSTKDLNDSLDRPVETPTQTKLHLRTHSCPSVQLTKPPYIQMVAQDTTRTNQIKPTHRNCRSQFDLDNFSMNQPSISIDNLSSILYRKNSKETVLKKSRVSGKTKFRPFTLGR